MPEPMRPMKATLYYLAALALVLVALLAISSAAEYLATNS